jgi:hypothetical protein
MRLWDEKNLDLETNVAVAFLFVAFTQFRIVENPLWRAAASLLFFLDLAAG